MIDRSRRRFFSDVFVKKAVRLAIDTYDAYQEATADADYFDSFESAYTLISENMPFIKEEAARLGIDTAGKSKLDIVQEIYEKNRGGL
jgi:5'(3')-deoxyribonucleotidase